MEPQVDDLEAEFEMALNESSGSFYKSSVADNDVEVPCEICN